MELARMDDVAGCRLIFPNYRSLAVFREKIHRARFGHKLRNDVSKYDYISNPKSDGYRGIHDITNTMSGPYSGGITTVYYWNCSIARSISMLGLRALKSSE
jgi:(p)ppGpp synthase/HD superfamily hydrolase